MMIRVVLSDVMDEDGSQYLATINDSIDMIIRYLNFIDNIAISLQISIIGNDKLIQLNYILLGIRIN